MERGLRAVWDPQVINEMWAFKINSQSFFFCGRRWESGVEMASFVALIVVNVAVSLPFSAGFGCTDARSFESFLGEISLVISQVMCCVSCESQRFIQHCLQHAASRWHQIPAVRFRICFCTFYWGATWAPDHATQLQPLSFVALESSSCIFTTSGLSGSDLQSQHYDSSQSYCGLNAHLFNKKLTSLSQRWITFPPSVCLLHSGWYAP